MLLKYPIFAVPELAIHAFKYYRERFHSTYVASLFVDERFNTSFYAEELAAERSHLGIESLGFGLRY
jgi:hypothetical protein